MGDPELIMIDEPTEGLAPLIVQQVGDLIARIAEAVVAILLVEQKLSIALRISHRVYIMGHGRIVFEGTPADLKRTSRQHKAQVGSRAPHLLRPTRPPLCHQVVLYCSG